MIWGPGFRPHQPGRTGDRDSPVPGTQMHSSVTTGRLTQAHMIRLQHHNVTHICKCQLQFLSAFSSGKENRIIKEEIISRSRQRAPLVKFPHHCTHSRLQGSDLFFMPAGLLGLCRGRHSPEPLGKDVRIMTFLHARSVPCYPLGWRPTESPNHMHRCKVLRIIYCICCSLVI